MKECALIVSLDGKDGGVQRRLLRIYSAISKNHWNIHLIIRTAKNTDIKQVLSTMKVDTGLFQSIKCCYTRREMLAECLSGKYAALHFAGSGPTIILSIIFGKLFGIKTLVTVESVYSKPTIGYRLTSYIVWKYADHLDILHPWQMDGIKKIRKNRPVTCTPGTFTDLDAFIPLKKEKALMFCAARLEAEKGIELLISAVLPIAEYLRTHEYKVLIAGRGYLEEQIKETIKENKVDDVVQMMGYVFPQDYLPKVEAAFSLSSSKIGNYPSQAVAEACASGCCIIATKSDLDPKEFLNDSFVLFCEENAVSLSKTICSYIELSDKEKSQIQKNARLHAEKHFNIQVSVDYFSNILLQLLKEGNVQNEK